MGAWGHEPFGNDDAADWLCELLESDDHSVIETALDAVATDADEYREAPECSSAIAAAEIVAAMLGRPSPSLPSEAAEWVVGKPEPSQALVARAVRAVSAVFQESELQELWADSEDYKSWEAVTTDLLARLG